MVGWSKVLPSPPTPRLDLPNILTPPHPTTHTHAGPSSTVHPQRRHYGRGTSNDTMQWAFDSRRWRRRARGREREFYNREFEVSEPHPLPGNTNWKSEQATTGSTRGMAEAVISRVPRGWAVGVRTPPGSERWQRGRF